MQPQYQISGKERKLMRKELSWLKYYRKMFWFYEDIHRVYGEGHDACWCENRINSLESQINKLSEDLKKEK